MHELPPDRNSPIPVHTFQPDKVTGNPAFTLVRLCGEVVPVPYMLLPNSLIKVSARHDTYQCYRRGRTASLWRIHSTPMDPSRTGDIDGEVYQEGEAAVEERADRLRTSGFSVAPPPILWTRSSYPSLPYPLATYLSIPNTLCGRPTAVLPKTSRRSTPPFEFVDRAATELKVFHYQEDKETHLPEARFEELLSEVRYDYFYQLADGEHAEGAIKEFVRSTGVDLLTLIHRQSTWLSRMLVASHTRNTVFTSPVPVLILQELPSL